MKLHLWKWGESLAPPVVCLHGISSHGGRFRRLAQDRLGNRHVLAPDLRGHGHSSWEAPWTLEAHVEDLLETLAPPEQADWIGYSFGGRLLVEIAARFPQRVARAVLLDPALHLPRDLAEQLAEAETHERFDSRGAAIEARLQVEGGSEHVRPLVEEEIELHLATTDGGGYRYRFELEAVKAGYRELARPLPAYESLPGATLLVVAEESKLVSAAELELMRRALGSRLTVAVVPGGHGVLWAAHRQTGEAVEAFLACGL